ncbi:MAG: SUMF1/EgtB/PvdO family nonheme iron enzyme, partial [Acetobacteraceae bacterium]|nr:SUMF1/EgtB/PvdO family nonheme iron enzyme [Acetobacteraceae bacterium]
ALRIFFEQEVGFTKVYFFAEGAPPIPADTGEPIQAVPTLGTLRRFLRVRFDARFLKPADNIWFFFAGHGRRERDRDYLMPIDADPGNVEETAVPVSYVAERLRRSGAENVILLLDACRNEGARDGQGVGTETQRGVVTISSCSPNERSYEIGELGHGAFTYSLLQGLRQQGESNCATVERLDQYLRYRVPDLCSRFSRPRQTPYTNAEPIEKRHLILLPRFALPEDVAPIKLDALEAETNGELETAEQLWWRVIAVSATDPQAHEAVKRIARKQAAGRPSPPPEPAPAPPRRVRRLTRRQLAATVGVGAAAIAGAIAAPALLRRTHRIAFRTASFETASVDATGVKSSPMQRDAEMFTQQIGNERLEMVAVPAGTFTMGSPASEGERRANEGPQHHVSLPRFGMAAFPVTQAQWFAVIRAHPAKLRRDLDPYPSFFRGVDLPVETITWNDADEFCARLAAVSGRSYRLPSEAEWEHACRAGSSTPFAFGPTLTPELANYCGTGGAVCGDSDGASVASDLYDGMRYGAGSYGEGPPGIFRATTTAAGTFPRNGWGLYDMHGNVWEFCLDTATGSYADAPTDGSPNVAGPPDERILRGGSWSHNPAICRSAYRDSISVAERGWQGRIGFRVVLPL